MLTFFDPRDSFAGFRVFRAVSVSYQESRRDPMQKLSCSILVVLALAAFGSPAVAQTGSGASPTSNGDRLFLSFIEDATLARNQWWEGQIEFADGLKLPGGDIDAVLFRGIAAFQPWIDVEMGVRVGFGSTDGPNGADGSGATDLEAWGKYYMDQWENIELAFGGVLTIPTGDETAGLGEDSFGGSAFGALRYRLSRLIISGHLGVQFNGDGRQTDAVDRDGETAFQAGGGVIYPFSGKVSGIAELAYDGGRLEGSDDMLSLLGGINWRVGARSNLRAAVAFGLDDGAPDARLVVGYAAQF
jgi:hypothetical protein